MSLPLCRAAAVPLAALTLLTIGAAPQAHAVTDSVLASKTRTVLGDSRVTAARNGTLVVDSSTGGDVHNRNGSSSLLPASNMKIVTAAASLRYLGSGYRFKTEAIARAGKRADGTVPSSVYLKGYGDPTVLAADLRVLAQNLRSRGITRFTGRLVADASFFDSVRYNRTWDTRDAPQYYAPQISGLTLAPNTDYDAGTVIVTAFPTKSGALARIGTTPAAASSYVRIVNKVRTGSRTSIGVTRTAGTNTVTVTGTVATSSTAGSKRWVTVNRPELYAAHVFRAELARVGISVTGSTTSGATPSTSRRIVATDRSAPLSAIMRPLLKLSNNSIAEHLIKTLGTKNSLPGTTAKGAAYLRSYLAVAKAPLAGTTIRDGSGLSRSDRLTPRALTRALYFAQSQSWFGVFRAALPVAGNPNRMVGGTLRNRMRNTAAQNRVFAKTGSMRGVTALSGYATGADGRRYVFAMLSNYSGSSPRPVEDRLAITIAAHRR